MSEIQWQKSSFSGGGGEDCIELASHGGELLMRESDDPDIVATPGRSNLASLLFRVKAGDFDRFAD
ncbi:DUF397 domain-containing protein [Streptomyces sp. NPDC001262]|uniref:DUF397 domain-containing protein n=1 Tax=Streptomyces sp. NPDC001262 TaxID=3364552 RepID=UPI00367DB56B